MYMKISKQQYSKLPNELKQYFILEGSDASCGGLKRNIHPT